MSDITLPPNPVFQVPAKVPAHSMDDINMLLYLDALKRSVDNQNAISQKIEEAYKTYQKRYIEYVTLYSKYVALVKKSCTRKVLQPDHLTELTLDTAVEDAKFIKENLSNDVSVDNVNMADLEKFKKIVGKAHKFANLENVRAESLKLKKVTESIQSAIESIAAGIDNGTNLTLDLSMRELLMTNFPKLRQKNEKTN